MRKLFFFRSSPCDSGNSNSVPPSPANEKVYWGIPSENGVNNQVSNKVKKSSQSPKDIFPTPQQQLLENQSSVSSPGLRRSLSFSSATYHSGALGERNLSCFSRQIGSPTCRNAPPQPSDYPSRCRSTTPERQSRAKRDEKSGTRKIYGLEKTDSSGSSIVYQDSSGKSSYSSPSVPLKCGSSHMSNVPNKILDLYIDGEQKQERNLGSKKNFSQTNTPDNVNSGCLQQLVFQSTAPASPTGSIKDRPRSYSFREVRDTRLRRSTRDSARTEFGPESSQKIAKNVVKRLSQVFPQKPKQNSRDFIPDTPTTVEDVFEDYLDSHPSSSSDWIVQKSCLSDGPYEATNEHHGEEILASEKRRHFHEDVRGGMYSVKTEDDLDVDLVRKAKEAEETAMHLSEEFEQHNLPQDSGFSVSVLLQIVRHLCEERRSLALEVSTQLQCRITERASAKEALKMAKVELDSRTRRLEKEKKELQSGLEKELDRRSSDWSFKLEKYHSEEQRLRERVRELAEQNVSLQREVSSFNCKETETRFRITQSEQQLKDLTSKVEEATEENRELKQSFSELQEQYQAAEADRDCIHRNYKEKEKENKELQKAVTRLQRTSSEQEKTIVGFRQVLSQDIENKQFSEKFDNVNKLQMEQVRLTGVEQILRREMESCRIEVESLRHENANLFDRLQGIGNEGGSLSFKLDQELWARVDCLQNQGLSLLNESSRLCGKLLAFVKEKKGEVHEIVQGQELNRNGLDEYFVVEADMKIQGFKRGYENLFRSLQSIAVVLQEKSNTVASESQSQCTEGDGSAKMNCQILEDDMAFKLKAETLLTSVLREKLCSKELEVEQLQAELATAARGHDIQRCDVQSALDAISRMTHKMKDLELQILRKDENMNQLQSEMQECMKELTITRGILPKVSEERDLMWEEVKQYSEKNMLLNSEVNLLKKKIETLDEDILLKEGQITILKDSLGDKPFDILYSPKSMQEFRLE